MLESITKMTNEISAIMDGKIHNAWLYGSVVLDDFRLGWSDIDFIVLTSEKITERQAQSLVTLRQTLLKKEPENPYYRSFEGIIANLDEYRSNHFSRLIYWGTTGQRITSTYELDAFSRYELAKYSKSVFGKDDWSLFSMPDRQTMISAVRTHYETIRKYATQTDEQLYSCGWLLDIARCIYTLRYHDVISKTQAGIWALNAHIFPDETPLRKAIEIRQHPLLFRDREDVKRWLEKLGPVIQRYADVLEHALNIV